MGDDADQMLMTVVNALGVTVFTLVAAYHFLTLPRATPSKPRPHGAASVTMEIVHTPSAVRAAVAAARAAGRRIAFVPTMGALHGGHLSLLSLATSAASTDASGPPPLLVVSIFVNPAQFAPHEDLKSYPRSLSTDAALCAAAGVHLLFAPAASDLYPSAAPQRSWVVVDAPTPETAARPAFFTGVATVVTKLLNVVAPDVMALGAKDGVQCITLRRLVVDLNMAVKVIIGPTMRESDGLAMSSRNVYLNPPQRAAAPGVYAALCAMRDAAPVRRPTPAAAAQVETDAEAAVQALAAGRGVHVGNGIIAEGETAELQALRETGAAILRVSVIAVRTSSGALTGRCVQGVGDIQYISFSDACTGAPIPALDASTAANGAVLLSVAVKVGTTRLIDNVVLFGTPDDLGVHASEVQAAPAP